MFTVDFMQVQPMPITRNNYFTIEKEIPELVSGNYRSIYFRVGNVSEMFEKIDRIDASHEVHYTKHYYSKIEDGTYLRVQLITHKELMSEDLIPSLKLLLESGVAKICGDTIVFLKNRVNALIEYGFFKVNESVYANLLWSVSK